MGKADLTVRLGDLALPNPVIVASGTGGYALELGEWIDISAPGAIVLKGLSLEPRRGNPPPRLVETPAGLLNSIGLENIGVEAFITDVLPLVARRGARLVANVYATSPEDFVLVCRRLVEAGGIAAFELNLSCPNVKAGGIAFGKNRHEAALVVGAVRREISLPVLVKLTPLVDDIAAVALACQHAGADALTVANTFPGMAVDIRSRRTILGGNFGGLSGPAVKPLTLKLVWQTCQVVRIPVVAAGGIFTWQDAMEFIIAGATAVQLGVATLRDPAAPVRMVAEIADYLASEGIASLDEIRGTLRLKG